MDLIKAWDKMLSRREIKGECWLYTGNIDPTNGYGRLQVKGERHQVHRISAAIHHGLNMNNFREEACHTCENKHCFNPDHIYKGNAVTNQRDVLNNKCPNGHDLGVWGAKNYNKGTKRYCRLCRSNRLRQMKGN